MDNEYKKYKIKQTKEFLKKIDSFHNYIANKKITPNNTLLHLCDLSFLCIFSSDDIYQCDKEKEEVINILKEIKKIHEDNDRTKMLILINKIKGKIILE